jgi:hypothetical protein
MKKYILLLLFSSLIYAQQFRISDAILPEYTIDNFTPEIYSQDYLTGTIWKTNLKTLVTTKSTFQSLPVFANKLHIAAYYDYDAKNSYIYNFEKNTSSLLADSIEFDNIPIYKFSPNDELLLSSYYLTHCVYNLKKKEYYYDSTLYFDMNSEWSSDTSLISLESGAILEYYLTSKHTDTLIVSQNYDKVKGFSYNRSQNKIYYSLLSFQSSAIHQFDKRTKKDSILYDLKKDEPAGPSKAFTELKWSKSQKLLGIIALYGTIAAADLYIYNPQIKRFYSLTANTSSMDGAKYNLNWIDDKTILYRNDTYLYLYGFNLPDSITYLKNDNYTPSEFSLQNYPNPFNNSTIISFSGSQSGEVYLNIYNSLGQNIKTYKSVIIANNKNNIFWDGTDNNGKKVSSGIYFCLLKMNDNKNCHSSITKMVLLK